MKSLLTISEGRGDMHVKITQQGGKVRLRRFIYYCCQFYIGIPWGNKFDLSESCPESWAGRIFAQTNIRLNGARLLFRTSKRAAR